MFVILLFIGLMEGSTKEVGLKVNSMAEQLTSMPIIRCELAYGSTASASNGSSRKRKTRKLHRTESDWSPAKTNHLTHSDRQSIEKPYPREMMLSKYARKQAYNHI